MPASNSNERTGFWLEDQPLVLASGSITRQQLLHTALIYPDIHPADIDERAIEVQLLHETAAPDEIARRLAQEKACSVSKTLKGRVVLGADQTLALQGQQLHKPKDRQDARDSLENLSGRTHYLHSGLALYKDGQNLWSHVETARMEVRSLSMSFIEAYLDLAGSRVLTSVGGYQYEGPGIHLFRTVSGDQSTILGLPLMPFLAALRQLGLVLR